MKKCCICDRDLKNEKCYSVDSVYYCHADDSDCYVKRNKIIPGGIFLNNLCYMGKILNQYKQRSGKVNTLYALVAKKEENYNDPAQKAEYYLKVKGHNLENIPPLFETPEDAVAWRELNTPTHYTNIVELKVQKKPHTKESEDLKDGAIQQKQRLIYNLLVEMASELEETLAKRIEALERTK